MPDEIRALPPILLPCLMLCLACACGSAELAEENSQRAQESENPSALAPQTEENSQRAQQEEPPGVGEEEAEAPEEEAAPAPEAPAWTLEARLEHGAYELPEGAPSVLVHAPPGLTAEGAREVVVFLHGWNGCVRGLALSGEVRCRPGGPTREGWDLLTRFDEARVPALFVFPQLAFRQRDGRPGRFGQEGGFRRFLDELFEGPLRERLGERVPTEELRLTLMAHSAGFEAALAVLSHGGVRAQVRHLALFDALYRGVDPFLGWAREAEERRLVSLYTEGGRTAAQSHRLLLDARRAFGRDAVAQLEEGSDLSAEVRQRRVVTGHARGVPHAEVPARYLATLLSSWLGG